jgi:diaminohydroxyphosphoribosylaminopyrimidine deaminase/5-amino-6-(5-phosphoribosylamino)uracil reductase
MDGDWSAAELAAMRRALAVAVTPGVPTGPNPRVGCVLLDPDGHTIAEGYHRGAGSPHAEVDALTAAGPAARGATAVVTLEPCAHTGRTGPCAQALIAAGVRRVVYAQRDGNPVAQGGAATLRAAGVDVAGGLLADLARQVNREWTFALEHARPFVTWKVAVTLDGRVAAADGSSRWITGATARHDVHARRAVCDAVVVGTGTVLVDDPSLTVRDATDSPLPAARQPLRVVVGRRTPPPTARVLDDAAVTLHVSSHDPAVVLAELWARGCQHVFLEGGPTLAAAFVRARLVDRAVVYVAPVLLGAGPSAVGDLGIGTITAAQRWETVDVARLADDTRIVLRPRADHPDHAPDPLTGAHSAGPAR